MVLDNKIVVFGMSCSGKTAFAKQLNGYKYYCFDELFHWHDIETLGLSFEANLNYIKELCVEEKFVLDGWYLGDKIGRYLPRDSVVYVVYASYDEIIGQYRVGVLDRNEHRQMYYRWYCGIDYDCLPGVRYFKNEGRFVEKTKEDYLKFVNSR